MAENAADVPNVADAPDAGSNNTEAPNTNNEETGGSSARNPRNRRPRNINNNAANTTTAQRSFEGATPAIGGVLALRSENVDKKMSYDRLKEILETYIIKNLSGGEYVIEGIQNTKLNVIDTFKNRNKPKELSDDEKTSNIKVEIKKEEIKEYIKKLNLTKSNIKKIYSIIYGNCTESV